MKRYSASVSHGEVEHEEDDAGMWVFRDEAEQAVSDAVAAERERIERDVADLHMTQATNNQNYPRAWHDGIDAALEVIRGA